MDVTSTVTAVNSGFATAGTTILQFINGNVNTILTVFGIMLAIAVVLRLFKRGSRA